MLFEQRRDLSARRFGAAPGIAEDAEVAIQRRAQIPMRMSGGEASVTGWRMSSDETTPTLATRTVAMPANTNAHGDVFGGWLLSQMDIAGASVATRRAEGRVVTVAVTGMTFEKPVFVGDEVTCHAEVVKTGRSSITVKLVAHARRGRTGEETKVTEGVFTYVAVDAQGEPRPMSDASGDR